MYKEINECLTNILAVITRHTFFFFNVKINVVLHFTDLEKGLDWKSIHITNEETYFLFFNMIMPTQDKLPPPI